MKLILFLKLYFFLQNKNIQSTAINVKILTIFINLSKYIVHLINNRNWTFKYDVCLADL